MHNPLTINGQGFGVQHISAPTGLAKQTNKGCWYPNWRFEVYRNKKSVGRLYHNLLHKSGNIVFVNVGYSEQELTGFKMFRKFFSSFDFYTISNISSCYQPTSEIKEAYESIGINWLSIRTNITSNIGEVLNKLPKKPILVGEMGGGIAIDLIGGFQVYNSYFDNYTDPYHNYSDYKQFVLEGKKEWKDLLLKTDEVAYHTGYHTRPKKNQQYKF